MKGKKNNNKGKINKRTKINLKKSIWKIYGGGGLSYNSPPEQLLVTERKNFDCIFFIGSLESDKLFAADLPRGRNTPKTFRMDLDGLDERSQVPSRTSRFAPKSSKFKPKPKSEVVPKPEPQQPPTKLEPQPPVSKPEVVEPDAQIGEKKEDGEEVEVKPKVESSLPNGVAKMDVETKSEVEEDTMVDDDPMEEDASEDMVVREIDVLFTPSVDSNSKVSLRCLCISYLVPLFSSF